MKNCNSLRVLIVDDEPSIRQFLKSILSLHGYLVFEANDGKTAFENFIACRPDVIVLDIGLPYINGINVTRNIRKQSLVPIIILSVRDGESDKVAALDAGADDYLTKPFGENELLARLRAVLRRLRSTPEEQLFISGDLSIDLANRVVKLKESIIELAPTEYDILKLFVLNAGKIVTHKQIYSTIWGKSSDFDGIAHLLRVTISNLRAKIEPKTHLPIHILTEIGVGYRFK